ncbi:MAG: NUDIX domain-containing protein [Ruminococcaceae bacterium]|jgi:bis(5'-nucleosidyl)-tetraphosphatase|nr:NUDIX domain-containing protein [Oscillospiraceae bacterium]
MKYEKSCGVIVFEPSQSGADILLICHRYGGHWAFPKGHVEASETETETALRELEEETGAKAQLLDGYREMTTYSPGRGISKDVIFFVGKRTGGTLTAQPSEVRRVEMLPYETALERLTYDADKQLLEKAKSIIFANL